jgi:NAD+ diphosphatase
VIIAYHLTATGTIKIDNRELANYKRVPISRLKPWSFATGLAVRDFLLKRAAQLPPTLPSPHSTTNIVSKL